MNYPEIEQVLDCYQDKQSLEALIQNNSYAASLALLLTYSFEILPLTKQLTNIAGNVWIKSLQNQRAERNEILLMHEFHKEKYIWPDKYPTQYQEEKKKKKSKYSGGLVLEPKPGLYEKIILLLDFNSLYPSIIQEYNLCFTTVIRPSIPLDKIISRQADENEEYSNLPEKRNENELTGVLPRVIRQLVLKRK